MTKKTKKLGVKITSSQESKTESDENIKKENNEDKSQDEDILESSKLDDNQELRAVCELLDKLTLEMLILMEQHIQQKLKIESTMTEGEAHLAKSRYILGHKNVSSLQLPTENSNEITPAVTLTEISNDETYLGKPKLKLYIQDYTKSPTEDEPDKEYIQDPMNWFGVLVPRNLHLAQSSFRNAIEYAVDCANTQTRLHQVCVKIQQLREIKKKLGAID